MLIKRNIFYPPAKETRGLHILLPDDYASSGKQYPVMYYFDGHNLFLDEDATYGKSWGLKEFLAGWEKELIIVGLECSHNGNDRLTEYCPYTITGDSFLSGTVGTGKETMDFIVNVLKREIDREFPTLPGRACTGICGSSMGGLMSFYAAIRYNHVFSKAACLSPSLGPCERQLFMELENHPVDPDTRIYLSAGTKEGGSRSDPLRRRFAAKIFEQGADARVYLQQGGRHSEASWEKQNERYLSYLWLDA